MTAREIFTPETRASRPRKAQPNDEPHRHSIGTKHLPVLSSTAVVIEVLDRMASRLSRALAPGHASSALAIGGPLAVEILRGQRSSTLSEAQLIVGYGDKRQVAAILSGLATRWPEDHVLIMQQLIDRARYLQLERYSQLDPSVHSSIAPAMTPTPNAQPAHTLLCAAMTTAQTSIIRVEYPTGTRFVTLSLLSPEGLLLAHAADVISTIAARERIRELLEPANAHRLKAGQYWLARRTATGINTHLSVLEERTPQLVGQLRKLHVLPQLAEYPKLHTPFLNDPAVVLVVAQLPQQLSMRSGRILQTTLAALHDTAASRWNTRANQPAAAPDITPRQSPPGR